MVYNFGLLDAQSRRMIVDRRLNKWSLFSTIIGQDSAVDAFADLCFKGLGDPQHRITESVMLVGPPSTGKTTIVKTVAKILNITTVITDATQLGTTEAVVDAILQAWAKEGHYLEGEDLDGVRFITLPSTLVLIDEIHALTRKSQDGLLKATERNDGMLFSKKVVLDCRNVFWIGATTDWGKLIPAFRTRFRRIDLVAPTTDQVVRMSEAVFRLPQGVCREIVKYGGSIPREVFAFGRAAQDAAARAGVDISTAIQEVARREGIDTHGMRRQRLAILMALKAAGEDGCLLRSLVFATGCQPEELLGHWLPPMQIAPPGQVPQVLFDGKYIITPTGTAELKKRGL